MWACLRIESHTHLNYLQRVVKKPIIMPRDVKLYLSERKSDSSAPEIAQHWVTLEQYHTKRLWHQLTCYLKDFIHNEIFQHGGLVELYHNFIADFELKMNSLTLVEIILVVSYQIQEPSDTISFLEGILEKIKGNLQARILCMTEIGRLKLEKGELDKVRLLIEEVEEMLDSLDGVTTVHAPFYDLSSKYHQIKADHAAYYRNALRYLGCKDLNEIPLGEQIDRTFSLALAALLGEGVYNFGELLAHPVLKSLQGTDRTWLIDVLYAFNAGDIGRFEQLSSFWKVQPDLNSNHERLIRKIRLLALMELVFKRQAHDRTIPFSTVSEVAQVPMDEVEHLTMKALSSGLVKGTIDEVSQMITMTWVQPRVLDLTQVSGLESRMDTWWRCIQSTINLVKDEVPDVVLP